MLLLDIYWTDVTQAIAAAIAVPGSIWALVVLLRRDKARESEIRSLSQIAQQLTNMLKVSETRYRESKKPQITISLEYLAQDNTLRCLFTNSNFNSTISKFEVTIVEDHCEINVFKKPIYDDNGNQTFHVDLLYSDEKPEWLLFKIKYETQEGYFFVQDVIILKNKQQNYHVKARAIINDNLEKIN